MKTGQHDWFEPRTAAAVIGVIIGIAGFLFGVISHLWNRRESRLNALGEILQPLIRSAQSLKRANSTRRMCEQLKHSFPEPDKFPEVVLRVNALVTEYAEHLKSSELQFRNAEAEFAARHFRFPDGISQSIKTAQQSLTELGRLVDAGQFDKGDVQLAKFGGEFRRITDIARGWRLADPIEGIRRRFRKKNSGDVIQSEFELTQLELEGVLDLLHRRATTQSRNSFVVHPPRLIIDDPSVLKADDVIEKLKDSIFSVVFQDGTARMLSLPELMAFTFNLVVFVQTAAELDAMARAAQPQGERRFDVSFRFAMSEIMQPEMVKTLLDKIDFADTASDF